MFVFVLVFIFCVRSSFAIILTRKRELIALQLLSFRCLVTLNALWLFLLMPLVCLQCVIVVCPDHTHLLFNTFNKLIMQILFKQGYRYHKLYKSYSEFYRRFYDFLSNFYVELKSLLRQGHRN